MIRNNDIQVIDSTMLKNMQVAEVLGLGIIFKSSQIKELIDIANKKFVDGITGAEMMVWKEM